MLWFQFIALATRETTDRNYPSKNMGGKTMTIVRSEAFAMAGSHQDHSRGRYPCNSRLMGNLFQFSFPHVAGLWWRPWVAMVPIHLTNYLQLSLYEGKGITFWLWFSNSVHIAAAENYKTQVTCVASFDWHMASFLQLYLLSLMSCNWVKIINGHFIKRAQSAVLK